MAWVYILKCADKTYYTGSTVDLEARLWQHQHGKGANYTARRLPVELVFSAEYERIDDAFAQEKKIQGWSRRKKEALIRGDYEALPALARKDFANRRIQRKEEFQKQINSGG